LAGIQENQALLDPGACPGHDPGFAGVTVLMTFYEPIKIDLFLTTTTAGMPLTMLTKS
jgi:hypothetical protein